MLTDSGVLDSSDFADDQALVASDVGPGIKRRLTLDPDVNLRLYSPDLHVCAHQVMRRGTRVTGPKVVWLLSTQPVTAMTRGL